MVKQSDNLVILNSGTSETTVSAHTDSKLFSGDPAYDSAKSAEKNIFGSKLQEARKRKKMSQAELAQELKKYNVSVLPAAISKWEVGQNTPNPYVVFALCYILDIQNPLTYFTGGMPERDYLSAELNTRGLMKVQEYMEDLIASGKYAVVKEPPAPYIVPRTTESKKRIKMVTMPISYMGASAGVGNFLEDENFHNEKFPASAIPIGSDFGVHVDGDSMMPVYTDGALVWVEICAELSSGEIGIFGLDGNAYIKKLLVEEPDEDEVENYIDSNGAVFNKVSLISLNEKYAPIRVSPYSDFHIFGRVLN